MQPTTNKTHDRQATCVRDDKRYCCCARVACFSDGAAIVGPQAERIGEASPPAAPMANILS